MGDFADRVVSDHYALERELGEGGMATVWLARDLRHDRLVALKIIRPELAGAIGHDRFLREVRLTARLQHPNIVPLLDSGVLRAADGTMLPWYAMAYLPGESLRARMEREPRLAVEEALDIAEAIAGALEAAHRAQIVHRDIKPENVLLADGHAYVVDFGVAKALMDTRDDRLTSTGLSIGTPAYMSPEQAAGDPVDARSDQYSLATVLYEMLTGRVPFAGSTAQALLARRLTEAPVSVRTLAPNVPPQVEAAVLRALERSPEDRYPDLTAFAIGLRRQVGSSPRAVRRRRRILTGIVVAAVGIGTVLTIAPKWRGAGPVLRDETTIALYQRGKRSLATRTDEGAQDALASFLAAVGRDSTFAEAWAGLAQTYQWASLRRFVFSGAAGDSLVRLAVAASERATALDGRNPEVLYTTAMVSRLVDPTDLVPILQSLRQAVAAEPRQAAYWHQLALALYEAGERDEALDAWRQSVTVDPEYTQGIAFLALGFMWSRRHDSAAVWADSAVAVNPSYLLGRSTRGYIALERGEFSRAAADFEAARRLSSGVEIPNGLAGSALVEARAGRLTEARDLMARVESLMTTYTPVPMHNALYNGAAYAALGNHRRAIEWLEAFEPRANAHFQLHLRCDPAFDPVSADPRFQRLVLIPRPSPAQGC